MINQKTNYQLVVPRYCLWQFDFNDSIFWLTEPDERQNSHTTECYQINGATWLRKYVRHLCILKRKQGYKGQFSCHCKKIRKKHKTTLYF